MNSFGITRIENKWFESYLNNRTQCVSVNGAISNPKTIMSGVPQGSILGRLLFLLFINDMCNSILNLTVDMYAVDILTYLCYKMSKPFKHVTP